MNRLTQTREQGPGFGPTATDAYTRHVADISRLMLAICDKLCDHNELQRHHSQNWQFPADLEMIKAQLSVTLETLK